VTAPGATTRPDPVEAATDAYSASTGDLHTPDSPAVTLRAAIDLIRAALGDDETLVLVGKGVEVTSKVQYANGTFQVTTKPKATR
jgi:hypothetical protein